MTTLRRIGFTLIATTFGIGIAFAQSSNSTDGANAPPPGASGKILAADTMSGLGGPPAISDQDKTDLSLPTAKTQDEWVRKFFERLERDSE